MGWARLSKHALRCLSAISSNVYRKSVTQWDMQIQIHEDAIHTLSCDSVILLRKVRNLELIALIA
jgi:hypothetical protein